MALVVADRVKETTTSVGTSTINLAGAEDNFETFVAGVGTGNTTYYAIVDKGNSEFEVGVGTVTSGTPDTLSRDTVLASSNSDALVNFSAGEKDVFCTQPADKAVYLDSSGQLVIDGTSVTATATELNYVDGVTSAIQTQLDSKLNLSGGTMTGALTLSGAPTADLHATTKIYVDELIAAGIHYHDPVRVESPDSAGSLNATYDNGTSGVGATLTNNGTQAALVIDGVTLATSDRVLIYNQTNAFENGIYTVTNTGSASTNWVLTRATDADSYGVDNQSLSEGTSVFVLEGDDGSGEVYACTTTGTITFGTTAINFSQIGRSAVITGNGGITVSGNEISANVNATVQTTGANSVSSTASRTYAVQVDGSNDLVVNVPWVDTDTNTDTTYTAGTGLTLSGTQFSVQDNYVLNSGDSIAGQLSVTSSTYPPLEVTRDAGAVTTGNYGALKLNTSTTGTPQAGLGTYTGFWVDNVLKGSVGFENDGTFYVIDDNDASLLTVDGSGNVTVGGTVDGRDLAADGAKLDGIESGATADQTAAEIRTLVESATDSNVFTDADHTKLNGIESGATADQTASEILTAIKTVDGSGSGLDADTVDGIQASSFIRNDTSNSVTNYANKVTFFSNTNAATTSGSQASLECYSSGVGNDAFMAFHVGGDYATYFGLDGDTNDLFVGGWSKGASRYKIWHAGNDGSGSGLDADLLDGQQGSYYYPASNPNGYTTNIGDITGVTAGSYLTGGGTSGGVTLNVDATTAATASKVVARDSNGDDFRRYGFASYFNMSHGTGTNEADTIFYSSTDNYIRKNNATGMRASLNVPTRTGGNASGTWGISITGSAANADTVDGQHASAFQPAANELTWVDQATGNYGTIKVDDDRGVTWAGYAIRDDWVLMADGATTCGMYNDTDNEWAWLARQNAEVELYYNNIVQAETASGYFLANNQMRSPIFYDSANTSYYCDPAGASVFNTSVTANDFYARGWFRNNDSGEGLYNQATGQHWYSDDDDYWNIAGGTSANGIRFRDEHGGTVRGYVYANNSNQIGFLDSDGQWAIRHTRDSRTEFLINNTEYAEINTDYLTHTSDIRSPIFYDSNNTAYYADPASTSRFNAIEADGVHAKDVGDYFTFYGDNSTSHSISARDSAGNASDDIRINSYGSVYVNLDSNNNNTSTADFRIGRHGAAGSIAQLGLFDVYGDSLYAYSAYSFRSPIFYDSNNTGYYTNPASTSVMNTIDLEGTMRHNGDTNTYIQFHAADQFRVVTGGSERLEVNNSQITSTEPIHAPSFHGDGSALTNLPAGGMTLLGTWRFTSRTVSAGGTPNTINIPGVDTSKPLYVIVHAITATNVRGSTGMDVSTDNNYTGSGASYTLASGGSWTAHTSFAAQIAHGSGQTVAYRFASPSSTTAMKFGGGMCQIECWQ